MEASIKLSESAVFHVKLLPDRYAMLISVTDTHHELCHAFEVVPEINYRDDRCSDRMPYNPKSGTHMLIHGRSNLYSEVNTIELHSCPVDRDSGAPVKGLMAHYKFEPAPDHMAVRVTGWFTHRGPYIVNSFSWLAMKPAEPCYHTLAGFGPGYTRRLEEIGHPMCFQQLALAGPQGWVALMDCGDAVWTPAMAKYVPNNQQSEENGQNSVVQGVLAPQAHTARMPIASPADLSAFTPARPLTATLAFGTGEVDLPALSPRTFPEPLPAVGDVHTLRSGHFAASFASRPDGVSILSYDLTTMSVSRIAGISSLVRLILRHLPSGTALEVSAEQGWGSVAVKEHGESTSIYMERPEGIEGVSVSIEARAKEQNRIEWRTRVLNTNPEYSVLSASYVGISFHGGAPSLFIPSESGTVIHNAYAHAYHRSSMYNNGFHGALPLFGVYNPEKDRQNGLYIAVHDTAAHRKDMTVQCTTSGNGGIDFSYPATNFGRPANSFELAGTMVWQLFDGDWYDLALIYRDFVRNHAEWLPVHGRNDSPAWMKEVPLYIMDWMPNDNPDADPIPISIRPEGQPGPDSWYKLPIRLAEELQLPFAYHLYNWHSIPFNNDYPHYFPTKEGLLEGVRALHEHKIYVMPYINGRLWDTRDYRDGDYRYQNEARANICTTDDKPHIEKFASHEPDGSIVELAVMCPSTALWQSELAKIVRRLFNEYEMDAVYIDQIAAVGNNLCTDPNHNHTPGNGDWWVRFHRLLMERLRREAPDGRGFATESNAEVYTDQFDGFLTWSWTSSDMVPAFPLIYGGYIAMIGRNTNGYKKSDLDYYRYHVAQAVLYGQQIGWINPDLVNDPDKLDFMKTMATVRYRFRDYFSDGDMLRPPQLAGVVPKIVTDISMGQCAMLNGDSVLAGAWKKRSDDSIILMIVNLGKGEMSCDLAVRWHEYGVAPEHMEIVHGCGCFSKTEDGLLNATTAGLECLVLQCRQTYPPGSAR